MHEYFKGGLPNIYPFYFVKKFAKNRENVQKKFGVIESD